MSVAPLPWGRHFLMCPPRHFGVLYEINPWMRREVTVDPDRALTEWAGLVAALRAAGATVEQMDPHPDVPDLVFTANAGVVNARVEPSTGTTGAGRFVPSHFRHPERQPETEVNAAWFAERSWQVERLPAELDHEGAGDALPFTPEGGHTVLLSGYSFRSDAGAATELSTMLGCPVRPLQLVDPRLYHLDLTFCPLDGRRALVAPLGWDAYGRKVIEALVPEPLVLTDDEALSFCANSVVVDRTIVMPATPPRVGRRLESWGFTVVECRVGEFLKAGGGCRCLTLALDTVLSEPPPAA
ncbi:MAG: dimethylarginine dimethylaminohydrolase family protein [Acidimicrobiales bacterium]